MMRNAKLLAFAGDTDGAGDIVKKLTKKLDKEDIQGQREVQSLKFLISRFEEDDDSSPDDDEDASSDFYFYFESESESEEDEGHPLLPFIQYKVSGEKPALPGRLGKLSKLIAGEKPALPARLGKLSKLFG